MKKNIKISIIIFALFTIAGCEKPLNKPQNIETVNSVEEKISEPDLPQEPSDGVTVNQNINTETPLPQISEVTETPLPPEPEVTEPIMPEEDANPPEPQAPDNMNIEKAEIVMPDAVISPLDATFGSPYSSNSELSNEKLGWYFNRNKDHQPPTAQRDFDITPLGGYYLGNINEKVIYLTFDEGYENGYTEKILDILKEKNVHAAFFLTKSYIRDNKELVQRMVDEGHFALNHSVTHPSFPPLTDDEIAYEIEATAEYFKEVTGSDMPKFFRPPMGEYSARTLDITNKLGYKTIFWSFAYKDWEVDNQPGADYAYKMVMDNLHNGSIMLLHAVSKSNTEALPDIIDSIHELGYNFISLEEL